MHACVAIGRTAEGRQVQGFAPCDDGNVERQLATPVGRGCLRDGEGRRGGELATGTRRRGRLSVEKFVVLAAGKENLQRSAGIDENRDRTQKYSQVNKINMLNIFILWFDPEFVENT